MEKSNFKKVIKIKEIIPPINDVNNEIIVTDYTNHGKFKKTKFNFISYSEEYICLNGDNKENLNLSNTYNFQKNDKLFFGAGCTIPRHKVREWGKDKKITITVKPEKANVNVISANWISNLFLYYGTGYNALIDKNNFIDFLNLNYLDKIPDFINVLKNNECDKILLPKFYYKELFGQSCQQYSHSYNKKKTKSEKDAEKLKLGIESTYCEMFGDEEFENNENTNWKLLDNTHQKIHDLNKLLSVPDSVINILDTTLIDLVNESSITIDNEMMDQLKIMLRSDDKKNNIMAMEIIANSNYKTSLHKILLIFREYGNTVWNCPERNHVNFKSLIKFIDLHHWYNPSYDCIVKCLMDKKYLTADILNELMPLVKDEMYKEACNSHSIFKVNTITVSNDVKRYFGVDVPFSENELKKIKNE